MKLTDVAIPFLAASFTIAAVGADTSRKPEAAPQKVEAKVKLPADLQGALDKLEASSKAAAAVIVSGGNSRQAMDTKIQDQQNLMKVWKPYADNGQYVIEVRDALKGINDRLALASRGPAATAAPQQPAARATATLPTDLQQAIDKFRTVVDGLKGTRGPAVVAASATILRESEALAKAYIPYAQDRASKQPVLAALQLGRAADTDFIKSSRTDPSVDAAAKAALDANTIKQLNVMTAVGNNTVAPSTAPVP